MKQNRIALRRTLGAGLLVALLLGLCVPSVLATGTSAEPSPSGGQEVVAPVAETEQAEPSSAPAAKVQESATPSADPAQDTQLPEDEVLPADDALPEGEVLPADGELPVNDALPEDEVLPADGALPVDDALPEDETLPEDGALPVDDALPEDEALPTDSELPEDDALPEDGEVPADGELLSEVMTFSQMYAAGADLTANTQGKITVDGSAQDWDVAGLEPMECQASTNPKVNTWRVARGTDGTVYLCLEGEANAYQDGQWLSVNITQNGRQVTESKGSLAWTCPSGTSAGYAFVGEAIGTDMAPFVMELSIPGAYFTDPDFMIGMGNFSVPAASIPVLDGQEVEVEEAPPVYEGIVIDGKFDDWAAVAKADADCPNESHLHCVDQAAMVFDGDYVYCYIHEAAPGGGAGAGTHGNGGWSILTDLGNELSFQLTLDNDIRGIAGAQAEHVGAQWEVAIPASALPYYKQSISFGLHYAEPFVTDVSNLDGSAGNAGDFQGIVIDGQYADWSAYPHTLITYTTPGDVNEDSAGALYVKDATLYGHVFTTLPAHLGAQGGEFLAAISIAFNGDKNFKATPPEGNFYPRILDIDQNGNITTFNEGARLEEGTHTLYIFDTRTDPLEQFGHTDENGVWHDATAQDLIENAFGEMKVTVNGYRDEMEFQLDLKKVADYIHADVSDLKEIEAQFGRLGQEWLYIAGTSSGPWLGVVLCLCAVGAGLVALSRKRKLKT